MQHRRNSTNVGLRSNHPAHGRPDASPSQRSRRASHEAEEVHEQKKQHAPLDFDPDDRQSLAAFEGSDPSRLRAAAQALKSSLGFFLLVQVHQVASLQGSRIIEGVRCRAGPRTTPVVIFVTVSTCSFASEAPESASARGPHTFESISRPRGPARECSTATQQCENQGTRGPFTPLTSSSPTALESSQEHQFPT